MSHQNLSTLAGKRILVTGAGGFLGKSLAAQLLREGARVGGLDRTGLAIPETAESENYDHLACDLENLEDTLSVVQEFRPEILIHLAAHPDAKEELAQFHATIRGNILATVNTLEAFHVAGGELFIYGDSCKVYGNAGFPLREHLTVQPLSSYAIAKVAGWEYCKLYSRLHDFATISVRPTLVYGPGQGTNLISYVAEAVWEGRRLLKLDGGSQTRDPLYIDDAIRAYIAVAEKGRTLNGRIINISGGFETTVIDLTQLIVELMDSPMRIEPDLTRMRPTETWRSFCEIQEAYEAIGWKPQISLQQGLKRTLDHLSKMRLTSERPLAKSAASGR
jgi:nucleoside-diphosphate-sugar epimerase